MVAHDGFAADRWEQLAVSATLQIQQLSFLENEIPGELDHDSPACRYQSREEEEAVHPPATTMFLQALRVVSIWFLSRLVLRGGAVDEKSVLLSISDSYFIFNLLVWIRADLGLDGVYLREE